MSTSKVHKDNGLSIMIDGIAGSGKSTIVEALYQWIRAYTGLSIFRLHHWKELDLKPPVYNQHKEHAVFFVYEPTRLYFGKAIREELSDPKKHYPTIANAHAFSLDRLLLYKNLVIPALEDGKIVIHDRGISTSLAYQSDLVMPDGLSRYELAKLPGNALALEHAPDELIFAQTPIEIAIDRIKSRIDDNKGIYADPEVLRRVDECFRSQEYRNIFLDRNTVIHDLDTSGTLDETKQSVVHLIGQLLENHYA